MRYTLRDVLQTPCILFKGLWMDRKLIAFNRFGLGNHAGERMHGNPVDWLLGQVEDGIAQWRGSAGSLRSQEILASVSGFHEQLLAAREKDEAREKAINRERLGFSWDQYNRRASDRLAAAVTSKTPFLERLKHFWANHFAISADVFRVRALAGAYEHEAIRPHVTGRFEDMLLAVEQHPAMLDYLDQSLSIGPNSQFSVAKRRKRKRGFNENLAREILELHTLGIDGGYSQRDVIELARALTGWTIGVRGAVPFPGQVLRNREPGEVLFEDRMHEPGTRTILGRSYPQEGAAQSKAVMVDLARHPSTARHISFKLARHFVADEPPAPLVRQLEQAYIASDGDLPSVYCALAKAPEAWAPAPAKFRTPWQWTIAMLRALGEYGDQLVSSSPEAYFPRLLEELGQPIWRPQSPAGFDDTAGHWAGPDALMRRVGLAEQIVRRAPAELDARQLAAELFGQSLSQQTRASVEGAQDPKTGLALLLVSPEILRC
jgi:uncharacterized protein (DUF1800 family)